MFVASALASTDTKMRWASSVQNGSVPSDLQFPQIIRVRYEAIDQKLGGHFILWSDRERVHYGLDPKLYPGARYVEVTQVTPTVGSITLTFVEIRTVSSQIPDYLHLTGNVRFRVMGMKLRATNFPSGQDMAVEKTP